jgi:hypothetical protein
MTRQEYTITFYYTPNAECSDDLVNVQDLAKLMLDAAEAVNPTGYFSGVSVERKRQGA